MNNTTPKTAALITQTKVRRICTHGRGVFGHIPNKRQRRIANRAGRSLVERSPTGKNAALQFVLDNVQHVLGDMHWKEQRCPRLRRLSNKRTRGKRLGMVNAKRINPYVGIHHYFEGSPAHRIIPFWR